MKFIGAWLSLDTLPGGKREKWEEACWPGNVSRLGRKAMP